MVNDEIVLAGIAYLLVYFVVYRQNSIMGSFFFIILSSVVLRLNVANNIGFGVVLFFASFASFIYAVYDRITYLRTKHY